MEERRSALGSLLSPKTLTPLRIARPSRPFLLIDHLTVEPRCVHLARPRVATAPVTGVNLGLCGYFELLGLCGEPSDTTAAG